MANGEIFRLDGITRSDVDGVADLHAEHLDDSPIVLFGDVFLRRFFYTTLVKEGLIAVTGCRVNGRVVGFISYTTEPLGFMTKGIRRYPFRLSWIMVQSFLRRPAVAGQVLLMLRFMLDRRGDAKDGLPADRGEVISLVAEPKYQKLVPMGGEERLTARLFREAMEYYKREGCGSVHFLVKPENRASNLFCSVMGCRLEKIVQGGVTTHRYVYELTA